MAQMLIFYVIRPYVLDFVKCVPQTPLRHICHYKNIDVLMAS